MDEAGMQGDSQGSAGPDERSFFRHPAFWTVLTLASVASVAFALRFFPVAFPVVGLDLAMDRETALERATELADEWAWGPDDFRQAASFGEDDPAVRTYLELELGVEDAFSHLVREAEYHPYVWRVRHFREEERTEVTVRFTPAGEPYGFTLSLSEDEPGAALDAGAARAIGESDAPRWGVDLARYDLVESSQETRPSGRIDHTFVYEREEAELGDGEARVRLRVAGDRLSEVRHLIRVPEAFSRRYQEIRSGNETVALAAGFVLILLFGAAGCGGGVFYLVRRGALIWRPALAWGLVVSGLGALAMLNGLPLAWMGYDTAVSRDLFLAEKWLTAIGVFVVGGGILAVVFMAAEGLTRLALPEQPYQWKLWSPGVANTRSVLGRTVGGYLLAGIHLGFVVAFYLLATRRDGWWMPSEALIQPDLIATYVPAITGIALSLMAGFWEESLFRAVPVAVALLLAARFGWKGLLVGMALVLQAVVFAAGHADYPQQPAYARVVELVVPATVWGLVYLRFGLLPVILAHALYNLTWFSLPLFSAPTGLWLDRFLVLGVALAPLGVVLVRVRRDGLTHAIPDEGLNRSRIAPTGAADAPSSPDAPHPDSTATAEPHPSGSPPPRREPADPGRLREVRSVLLGGGAVGLVLWAVFTPFAADVPPLDATRVQVVQAARDHLDAEGIGLDQDWTAVARVQAGRGNPHRFVWREGGPEAYWILMEEGYLDRPSWLVRFVRFAGPVEERAEEFRLTVRGQGEVSRRRHVLPEERPGAELEEEEARELAHGALRALFGLDPTELEGISAEANQRPERVDWTFTFSNPRIHPMERGDSRLRVAFGGDRLVDGVRFVHVPEEWEREQRQRSRRAMFLGIPSFLLLAGVILGTAVVGVIRWARGKGGFRPGAFWATGALLVGVAAIDAWNRWPATVAGFDTTRPFQTQVFTSLATDVVGALILGAAAGLSVGFLHGWARSMREPREGRVAEWGILAGLTAAGLIAFFRHLLPPEGPLFLSYAPAGSRIPSLTAATDPVVSLVFDVVVALFFVVALDRATRGWTRARWKGLLLALAAGVAVSAGLASQGVATFVAGGVGAGVLFAALVILVRTLGVAVLPPVMAVLVLLPVIRGGIAGSYPGAGTGAMLAAIVLLVVGVVWSGELRLRPDRIASSPGPTSSTTPG